MNKEANRFPIICIYLALTLCIFAVYWQVRTFDFVQYDDQHNIINNSYVYEGISLQSIRWAFSSGGQIGDYNPLTWLSHMLVCEIWGLQPSAHHLINVFLHAANAILLFLVIRSMTGALWPSAFVAAVFAIHPLRVESVAWVSERKDVLYGFFAMLTFWSYKRYAQCPRITRYLIVLLTFTAALLSKVMAITLPFVLLLLDYWPLCRLWPEKTNHVSTQESLYCRASVVRLVIEKLPLFAMSAAITVTYYFIDKGAGSMTTVDTLAIITRVNNALVAYVKYILMMIWPSKLAVLYPHPGYTLPLWQPIVSAVLLMGISATAFYMGRRKRYLIVGWFWYLGTLLPVIGLVQFGAQAMADRYTYVSLIGLYIVIAWALPELLDKSRYKKSTLCISAIAVLLALSICTALQLKHWRNSETLFKHTVEVTKNNYIIHGNLAEIYSEQEDYDNAIKHYLYTHKIVPDDVDILNNLGIALAETGKFNDAIKCFYHTLQLKPDSIEAHFNLGNIFKIQSNFDKAVFSLPAGDSVQT